MTLQRPSRAVGANVNEAIMCDVAQKSALLFCFHRKNLFSQKKLLRTFFSQTRIKTEFSSEHNSHISTMRHTMLQAFENMVQTFSSLKVAAILNNTGDDSL